MVRSILSVFAGMVCWTVLWLGMGAALRAAMPTAFDANGMTQSNGILTLILVLSVAFSIIAGYITGVFARRREITHTLVLGVIQLGIGMLVQSSVWDQMPLWYHLSFLVLLIPGNVLGGTWRARAANGARSPGSVVPA